MPGHLRRRMRTLALLALVLVAALVSDSCGSVLSRKYEYDEEMYVRLDGSATVNINASVAALVALRGVALDPGPRARLDREAVRAIFASPVATVTSVSTSRRDNRRYVHVRLEVPDLTRLAEAAPFAWSTYALTRQADLLQYRQRVGPSAGRRVDDAGWTGAERVAFRLHLPSRVPYHNSPSRTIERGNIIAWEQPLADRIQGKPVEIEVHMENESILFRTLMLFGLMVALAALTFAVVIWLVMRRGRAVAAQPRKQEAL